MSGFFSRTGILLTDEPIPSVNISGVNFPILMRHRTQMRGLDWFVDFDSRTIEISEQSPARAISEAIANAASQIQTSS